MLRRTPYKILRQKRCLLCGCHDTYYHNQKWVRGWSSDTLRVADIDTESV